MERTSEEGATGAGGQMADMRGRKAIVSGQVSILDEASLRSVTVNPPFFRIPCKSKRTESERGSVAPDCADAYLNTVLGSQYRTGDVHQVAVPVALNNEGPERPVGV